MTDTDDATSVLHNETPVPAADATAPTGSITSAFTFSPTGISIGVPATDAGGSGVSLVRVANAGTTTDGLLDDASARTFAYGNGHTPAFTITSGADGPRTVWAQWRDAVGNWSEPVSGSIELDTTPPTGSVVINGGAVSTDSRFVTLTIAADDGVGSGASEMQVSNTPEWYNPQPRFIPFSPSFAWKLDALTGAPPETKTVYVRMIDAVGNASVFSAEISLAPTDLIPPTTPGVPRIVFGSAIADGSPVRATWAASSDPGGSGLRQYDVSGFWGSGTVAPSTRSVVLPSYFDGRVTVRAVDGAGNESLPATSARYLIQGWPETPSPGAFCRVPSVTYAGHWATSRSAAYLDGAARYSVSVGASVSFRFCGKSVAVIGRRGPTSGRARVYVNGVYLTTIDLYSPTVQDGRVIFHRYWSTTATRTVRLVLAGPTTRPRVTIDGFWLIK